MDVQVHRRRRLRAHRAPSAIRQSKHLQPRFREPGRVPDRLRPLRRNLAQATDRRAEHAYSSDTP